MSSGTDEACKHGCTGETPDLTPEAPRFRISWRCSIHGLDNRLAPTSADPARLQADYCAALSSG